MATDPNKNATKADLLAQVASLQEQLAAAAGAASQKPGADISGEITDLTARLADARAETAAARNRVDELIAQLAEANAERSKLAALLEASHQALQMSGAELPAGTTTATAAEIKGPAVVVRTRQGRELPRYRAGRSFTREEVTLPLSHLDEDQLEALRNDRELVVTDRAPD